MTTGKVKWFNNAKGYGFILAEAGGEDLFAHYSTIQMDGYKTLRAGQDVDFDIEAGPKGMHAINIRAHEIRAHEIRAQEDNDAAASSTTPASTQSVMTADRVNGNGHARRQVGLEGELNVNGREHGDARTNGHHAPGPTSLR